MSKLAPTSTKYVVKATIKANGVVEKPDIIGAVFGQTEGLLGSELDLRELQRTGRIGRIDVKIKSVKGKSTGQIIIPSSLDAAETSLIAATLETIERVGPCTAKISLDEVEDTRSDKRKYVVDKAKEILKNLSDRGVPDSSEISEEIKEAVRTGEVMEYHGLTAGPGVLDSDDILIVEGRADVLNLLKFGIRNAIAIEGTSASRPVIELAKRKTATLFVDGDRGGQLIAKELLQLTDLDYIAQAPQGKEVEELSQKEAYKALREKVQPEIFMSEGTRRGKAPTADEPELKPATRAKSSSTGSGRGTSSRSSPRGSGRSGSERSAPQSRFERDDFDDVPQGRYEREPSQSRFERDDRPSRGRSDSHSRDRDSRDSRSRGSRYGDRDRGSRFDRDDRRGGRDSRGGRFSRDRDDRFSGPRVRITDSEKSLFKKTLDELVGTRAACIFNDKNELMGRVPVTELENTLKTLDDPHAVIFDGKADYRLGEVCKRKGVRYLVGMDKEDFHSPVMVMSRTDLDAK